MNTFAYCRFFFAGLILLMLFAGNSTEVLAQTPDISLRINQTTVNPGDSLVFLNVSLDNPNDTLAGFAMYLTLSNSEALEFRYQDIPHGGLDVNGTLMENWELFLTSSPQTSGYDLLITSIANNFGEPETPGIAPQTGGLLCRLVFKVNEDIPENLINIQTHVFISRKHQQTNFSDPFGNLIGNLSGDTYDTSVSFVDGGITVSPKAYLPGDTNCDGQINVGDVVHLVNYVFKNGPPPGCE
ncbi:MAG: hypothetical protein KAR42_12755 [candidate division Zixibacteria bacterium]|nr:hypothetical protein [candidate division Zixibacteria bacterium]